MPNLAGLASQATTALSSTMSQAQSIASGVSSTLQSALQAGQSIAAGIGQLGGLANKVGSALGLSAFQTKFSSQDFQNGSVLSARRSVAPEPPVPSESGPLRFPLDTPKYAVMFTFKEYSRPQALQTREKINPLSIVFPMPSNLVEEYGVQYKTPALGPIIGAASDLVQRNIQGSMGAEQAGQAIRNSINKDAAAATAATAAQKIVEGMPIIGGQAEALGAAISRATGVVPNPHLAVIFESVNLRSHTFTYRFSPNSENELKQLKTIVKKIKKRILPKKSGEFVLTFPNIVEITFQGLPADTIIIKECVVEDFKVNYTPQGSPAFFKSGDPVEVEITLLLKEIEAHTSEDIK